MDKETATREQISGMINAHLIKQKRGRLTHQLSCNKSGASHSGAVN